MEMKIKINEVPVKVEFVEYIRGGYDGMFEPSKHSIKILATSPDKRPALVNQMTLAFLHYYGFAYELNSAIVCSFIEVYGERIFRQVDALLNATLYS